MGLSNTGTETISVDAELLPEISPFETTGTYAGYSNSDTVTELRYLSFNTKTSKLWNTFAKEFKNEIKETYKLLRNAGIYNVSNIMENALSMTNAKIGEIYYNKDAGSKYLSQTTEENSEYLKMLHGNRVQRYRQFISQRLHFLDTVFGYMESEIQTDTLNSIITLRSDALYGLGLDNMESLKCYLGITVYTPQYVTISVGSGMDAIVTAYVSPDSKYIDPDTGIEHEGTLFSFPIKGTDKEMIISGAGNIKELRRLEDLNVRDLTITKARKINKLNLAGSNRMSTLTLGQNVYLRELNCSNSYLLGTGVNGQTLDLTECRNLRKLDISNTKITSVSFPPNGNMTDIKLQGSQIKGIDVTGMEFLSTIDISNCENLSSFILNSCPKVKNIDIARSLIKDFSATNCKNLESINVSNCAFLTNFDVTNSDKIKTITMDGNLSPIMNDLQFYSLYSLENISATGTTKLVRIRLPKYANAVEAAKAANGEPAELWHGLKSLKVNGSSIEFIQYGSADVSGGCLDLSQLTGLTSLNLNTCRNIKEIKNVNLTGTLTNIFENCSGVTKISGSLKTNGNSITSLFRSCTKLSDINNLTFSFPNVTTANAAMFGCSSANINMLKKVLDACGSKLTNVDSIYEGGGGNGALPSNLFANNPNITTMKSAFISTGFNSIPGDLLNPMASKLQYADTIFGGMGSLKTVGNGIFKNKPVLNSVYAAFNDCGSLETYIDSDPRIFSGSTNIKNAWALFSGCSKLKTGAQGLEGMLDDIVNVENIHYMFAGCAAMTAPVPEGFISLLTKIKKIDGLFLNCSGITQLPNSLFRKNTTDTNKLPNITLARNVFGNCTNLTGIVSAHFFEGAESINDISNATQDGKPFGGNYSSPGFFGNTAIEGYHEDFLKPLTNLVNCSYLFNHDSVSTTLQICQYYNKTGAIEEYNCSVSDKFFANNKFIQKTNGMFRNNAGLKGHIPPDFFTPCKSSLIQVSSTFEGCAGLTGANLDNNDDEANTLTGISPQWFTNAKNLQDVSKFMSGCTAYAGYIPNDLLLNCTSLQSTSGMFTNCKSITGSVPIELFNSCRETIRNTSSMFNECSSMSGRFPTGVYTNTTGVVGYEVCNPTDEGALAVVTIVSDYTTQISYSTAIDMSPGLSSIITPTGGYYVKPILGEVNLIIQAGFLAECLNLENTSGMFSNCGIGEGSAIPYDLFYTSSFNRKYTKLTNISNMFWGARFTEAYEDPDNGRLYFCPSDLFSKCPSLESIGGLFFNVRGLPASELYMNLFDKQTKLKHTSYAFGQSSVSGSITANFMRNSIGTLENVGAMFANLGGLTYVDSGFLNQGGVNKKLKGVTALFQGCGNLTGRCPEFWNPQKFPNIPVDGCKGVLAGATKVENYQEAVDFNTYVDDWVSL